MLEEQFNTTLKLRVTDRRRSSASVCRLCHICCSLIFCEGKSLFCLRYCQRRRRLPPEPQILQHHHLKKTFIVIHLFLCSLADECDLIQFPLTLQRADTWPLHLHGAINKERRPAGASWERREVTLHWRRMKTQFHLLILSDFSNVCKRLKPGRVILICLLCFYLRLPLKNNVAFWI